MALNNQNDVRANSAKIIKEMIQATKIDLYKFLLETQKQLDYILQIVDTSLKQTPVNDRGVQTELSEEEALRKMRQALFGTVCDTGEDSLQQQQSTIAVSVPIIANNFDHSNTVTNINNNCSQNLDQRIVVKQEEPPNNHQTQSNDMSIIIESDIVQQSVICLSSPSNNSIEEQSVICLSSSSNNSITEQSVIGSSSSSSNSTSSGEYSDWEADNSDDITSESEVDVEGDDINKPSTSTQRATRPAASRQNWQDACRQLLETLWQCEDSIPFREPVNLLEHPDYYKVINTPMDLRTVKEELLVGSYKSPSEFAKNMKLIFANSKSYNTNTRSKIYSMTIRLSAMFEEHMLKIMKNRKLANHRKTYNSESENSKKGSSTKSQLSNGVSIKSPTKRKAVSSEDDDDDDDDGDDDNAENEDPTIKYTDEDEEDEEAEHSQNKKRKKIYKKDPRINQVYSWFTSLTDCDEKVDNDMNTEIKTEIKQEPMADDQQKESSATASGSQQEKQKSSIDRHIQSLVHAGQCKDANCRLASCQRMKRVVTHIKTCQRRISGGCPKCKKIVALCCHHANHCQEADKCLVPFCFKVKHKLRQQQHHQRVQQVQLLRPDGPECGLKTVPLATTAETYRETGSNTADTLQQKSTSHAGFPDTNPTTERQHVSGYAGPLSLSQSQQQQQQQPGQSDIGGMDGQMPKQAGVIDGPAGQVGQNAAGKQAMQGLMQTLRILNTPEDQNKILHILKRFPSLTAAFIKQRQAAQDEDE